MPRTYPGQSLKRALHGEVTLTYCCYLNFLLFENPYDIILVRVVVLDDLGNITVLRSFQDTKHPVKRNLGVIEALPWSIRKVNRAHSFRSPTCMDEGQGIGECGTYCSRHRNGSFTLLL